jgi:hypothetical protein
MAKQGTAADSAAGSAQAVAGTAQVSLCIGIVPLQENGVRGEETQWAVSAWATGGNVPDATIKLRTSPAGAGTPNFSFGCGSADGTSACDLGAVDAGSAQRQLQARLTVPLTATTVTSVSLTATGSAANLHTDPVASAAITVLTPPASVLISASPSALPPIGVAAPIPTLSPGGNASDLFPTVGPSPQATGGARPATSGAGARQVADTSALSAGASHIGSEVVGLAALGLAFALAVTRLSIRRPAPPAPGTTSGGAPVPEAPAEVPEASAEPEGQPEDPPAAP